MTAEIMTQADQVIAKTYKRFPMVLANGNECTVHDTDGRSYTDFVAGIAVCNLGHSHPKLTEALSFQAQTLWHVSNLYYTKPQVELAGWLVKTVLPIEYFFATAARKQMRRPLSWPGNFLKIVARINVPE